MVAGKETHDRTVTILCPKLILTKTEPWHFQWLIGSNFLPPLTIVSTVKCIHKLNNSPDFVSESEDLRSLIVRGFHVIGALVVVNAGADVEASARDAIAAAREFSKLISELEVVTEVLGAVVDSENGDVRYYVSRNQDSVEAVTSVTSEEQPEKMIWEKGCLLRCKLPINLPVYVPTDKPSAAEEMCTQATEAVVAKFKDPQVAFIVERLSNDSSEAPLPVVIRGGELDFNTDFSSIRLGTEDYTNTLTCGNFCSKSKSAASVISPENVDILQVSALVNRSEKSSRPIAPIAEYFPALEETKILAVNLELEVICYAIKDLPLALAISKLIIPGLIDQLNSMKKKILPNLLMRSSQLCPYHFNPPGFLNPVTVIYELNYGETELAQVEVRKSLHLRLGLPLDRPLLRIANALDFSPTRSTSGDNLKRRGTTLLRDVHNGIPSSGVAGGVVSMIQGSYEYYHYLHDGFDDSGWGCAYRSLQTIISWFRLQHYTSIDVPSHREIQQALVEIGDKDPSFIGSRDWIGAIELSFVLDKLLGVSCKIINVRSGAELPEKCRELALHFENQGTPIMIGGGVLAYTLLGVDYNEGTGDCAFLILDPHYTGSDDHKKIINGGWCGWKKAVDSKGKNFFLHDKFYNLLLPQRPNMV